MRGTMTRTKARMLRSLGSLLGLGGGTGLLLLGLCLIASGITRSSPDQRTGRDVQVQSSGLPPALPTRAIQDVRVGDRMLAGNPEGAADEPEVDPPTWRKITLEMRREGVDIDITLLRPLAWVESKEAAVGGTVELDLPEMEIVGTARVLRVDPCPPLKPGKGCVVTGTFAHDSEAVLDLRLEGLDEPIGVTANHPFYSDDRNGFVRAGELRTDERLRPQSGATRVVSVAPRAGRHRVYNLEIHGEHAFRVSTLGVLVHNNCEEAAFGLTRHLRGFKKVVPNAKNYMDLGLSPGHPNFSGKLLDIMRGAKRIRFNLTGMNQLNGPNGVLTGPRYLNQLGSTNWELRTIWDSAELRSKTRFFLNGKRLKIQEVLDLP